MQRKLAAQVMCTNTQGRPRLDAVMVLISALEAYQGTPEKARSTAAYLVSTIETRQTGFDHGNPRLLQLLKAADVQEAP